MTKETDYPDNNPKTLQGATKIPLDLVPPSAIHALANVFADGAVKYGPYNWREHPISASVYYAACLRHLSAWWDGEDLAVDSGKPHIEHAMACLAMIIDGKSIGKLNDNRPPRGASAQMQLDFVKSVPEPGLTITIESNAKHDSKTVFCSECGGLLEWASPTCLFPGRHPSA